MSTRKQAECRAKRTCQGCHQRRPERSVLFVSKPEALNAGNHSPEAVYKWYGLWLCGRCRQLDFDDFIRRRMQFNGT